MHSNGALWGNGLPSRRPARTVTLSLSVEQLLFSVVPSPVPVPIHAAFIGKKVAVVGLASSSVVEHATVGARNMSTCTKAAVPVPLQFSKAVTAGGDRRAAGEPLGYVQLFVPLPDTTVPSTKVHTQFLATHELVPFR